MDVTDEMLTAAVRKAVELRILPAVAFTDQYVKNWEAIRAVVQAGLVVSLEAEEEIAKLRAEVERLRAERDALLALLVRPSRGGGFIAPLDWQPGGYPGGVVAGHDPGCERWWFATREEAEAAVMGVVRGGGATEGA